MFCMIILCIYLQIIKLLKFANICEIMYDSILQAEKLMIHIYAAKVNVINLIKIFSLDIYYEYRKLCW